MSISINYRGRFGNRMFQYIAARVFSEIYEINLISNIESEVIKTTEHKTFDFNTQPTKEFKLHFDCFTNDDDFGFWGYDYRYIFNDFFQNSNFFNKHIDRIKSFFVLNNDNKNFDDIVMHVRLDDFIHSQNLENPETWDNSEIIHPDYYHEILKNENFKNLYIVHDQIKYEWEKKYLSQFDKYNPIFISNSPEHDFSFIMKFNKIINSNSTFSYWSSFLSNAEIIYTFKKTGFYGKNNKIHGPHIKNLDNLKNISKSLDFDFYFNN